MRKTVIIEGSDKITKARKPHVCSDCKSAIAPGEYYTRETFAVIRGGSPSHIPARSHCGNCLPRPGVITRRMEMARLNMRTVDDISNDFANAEDDAERARLLREMDAMNEEIAAAHLKDGHASEYQWMIGKTRQ